MITLGAHGHFLSSKTSVLSLMTNFIAMVKAQFGATVKQIRADNGTDFFNPSLSYFLTSLGIEQRSCVSIPQQNGRVEKKHKTFT